MLPPNREISRFPGRRRIQLQVCVAGLALTGAATCLALYVFVPGQRWSRDWMPGLGASLLIGGLGLVIVNVLIDDKLEELERRRYQGNEQTVARLLHQLSQWLQCAHVAAYGERAPDSIWPDPLSDGTLRDVKRWIRRLDHVYAPLVPPESWQAINDIWLQIDRQLDGMSVSAWANADAVDGYLEGLQRGFLALTNG